MSTRTHNHPTIGRYERRRGVVAVKVAIFSVVLLGFAALGVDVGMVYNAAQELQRAVDASAMAGASMLARTSADSGLDEARENAIECAADNNVAGEPLYVAGDDVEFGFADYDEESGEFEFTPDPDDVNAVRVTGRRTEDNEENGPIGLFFARILGFNTADLQRSATALMQPRDIAIAADLSGSHNNDSELRNLNDLEINLGDVWAALPGGIDDDPSSWGAGWDPSSALAQGFSWGFFQRDPVGQQHGIGFGYDPDTEPGPTTHIEPNAYAPHRDIGLVKLELGFDAGGNAVKLHWTPVAGNANDEIVNFLVAKGYSTQADLADFPPVAAGDSPTELYAVMGDHLPGGVMRTYNWVFRAAVATGFAEWYSGIPGGKWESGDMPAPFIPANGNEVIDGWEVVWGGTSMGNRSPIQMALMWVNYAKDYVLNPDTFMVLEGDPGFQWRFGPKTFTNFLLESKPTHADTPELAGTPHQPTQAVKDAVGFLANALSEEYHDLMSLEIYGTTAVHEVDLTEDILEVPARLHQMQAMHYDGYTNIGGGLREGRASLMGPTARPNANKVLVLLSDGVATAWENLSPMSPDGNVTGHNTANSPSQMAAARAYAIQQAEWARDAGIQVFAVALGAGADVTLMQEIAEITNGRFFQVLGSEIAVYSQELIDIFTEIAIARSVSLVQ